ncbi:hypothetical protein J7L85_00540 [candidate division WOR-3 bacterium]|nr:hypothetical protein [candidate division WOR-3 bacterium]
MRSLYKDKAWNIWNTKFKYLEDILKRISLWEDLIEEIEIMCLEAGKDNLRNDEIDIFFNESFKEFLKNNGFRNISGKWKIGEV